MSTSDSNNNLALNVLNPRRCAACKYLRRRCSEDCILSPYFPPSLPDRFACVHRIFGASNIARMLQQLPAHQRAQAADALSLEAYWRVRDPIYGSVGIINLLQQEIYANQHELARTQAQIAMYTAQHHHHRDHHHQQQQLQQQQQEQREAAGGAHEPVEPTPFLGPPQQDNCALERSFLEFNHFQDFF